MEIASRARIEILQAVGRMSSCSVKQLVDTGYYSHFLRLRIRSEFAASHPHHQINEDLTGKANSCPISSSCHKQQLCFSPVSHIIDSLQPFKSSRTQCKAD